MFNSPNLSLQLLLMKLRRIDFQCMLRRYSAKYFGAKLRLFFIVCIPDILCMCRARSSPLVTPPMAFWSAQRSGNGKRLLMASSRSSDRCMYSFLSDVESSSSTQIFSGGGQGPSSGKAIFPLIFLRCIDT